MAMDETNDLARALRIMAMTPRGEALINDLQETLSAERDRLHDSATYLDNMTAVDGNGKPLTKNVLNNSDADGMTLSEVAVMRSAPGELLTDTRKGTEPITRSLSDSAFSDPKGRAIDAPIMGKLYRDSNGNAVDAIWHAIGIVTESGMFFQDDRGKEIRIPALPAMVAKAVNRFGGRGQALKAEHVDDIVSSSVMRAYMTMKRLILSATPDEFVSYSPEALGTVAVHAPMGEIAGVFETRSVRCGECKPCRAGYVARGTLAGEDESREAELERARKASTTDIKSRYNNGRCLSPKDETVYVDMQLMMQRCIYAESSAHVSFERYADKRFMSSEELTESQSATVSEAMSSILTCGHNNCTREECRVFLIVHAARIVCEALGKGVVAGNGKPSTEFLDMVSVLAYPDDSLSKGRARRKARSLIVAVLSGDRGTTTATAFAREADRQAKADAAAQRLTTASERVLSVQTGDSVATGTVFGDSVESMTS
jgi:hypothetical protein